MVPLPFTVGKMGRLNFSKDVSGDSYNWFIFISRMVTKCRVVGHCCWSKKIAEPLVLWGWKTIRSKHSR